MQQGNIVKCTIVILYGGRDDCRDDWTCGDHFVIYLTVESLCYTPEIT